MSAPTSHDEEIEVTPEMIAAGEDVILGELGGSPEVASLDFVRVLAAKVYRAMEGYRERQVLGIASRSPFDKAKGLIP